VGESDHVQKLITSRMNERNQTKGIEERQMGVWMVWWVKKLKI